MAKVIGQKAGEGGEQAPWVPGTEFNSVRTGQGSGAPEWPARPQQAGSECRSACLSPGLSQGICVCLPSACECVSFSLGVCFSGVSVYARPGSFPYIPFQSLPLPFPGDRQREIPRGQLRASALVPLLVVRPSPPPARLRLPASVSLPSDTASSRGRRASSSIFQAKCW